MMIIVVTTNISRIDALEELFRLLLCVYGCNDT